MHKFRHIFQWCYIFGVWVWWINGREEKEESGGCLCGGGSLGDTGSGDTAGSELALVKTSDGGGGSLGDLRGGLDKEDLSVNGVAVVGVDTTVRTVRAAAGLGRLLDHDRLDEELGSLESLGLRVRLSVLEQGKDELDRLDGPSGYLKQG